MKLIIGIHVDGGPGVGLGHASRGVGLAYALKARGFSPTFLVAPDSGLSPFLNEQGYNPIACPSTTEGLVGECQRLGAKALIVDSYRFKGEDFLQLNRGRFLVVCFDDIADRELPVDIVINGSPAAEELLYRTRLDTRRLLGLPYQVVRQEFSADVPREFLPHIRSILVTIGGGDPLGIFEDLLSLFKRRFGKYSETEVNFIAGPFFDDLGNKDLPKNVRIHHNPNDLLSLIIKADIAVSAGGQTLYELARCGTPTVAFCVSGDQTPQLEALSRLGSIDYIGWAKNNGWLDRLVRSVENLRNDHPRRKKLGTRAAALTDGQGAQRITTVIQETLLKQEGTR